MNKLFRLISFIFLLYQNILADQYPVENVGCTSLNSDIQLSENTNFNEGFLQGTLVETLNGYIPIEQIEVGDYVVGLDEAQQVLSIRKGKINSYVRLLLSNGEYVYAAKHQDFYLYDGSLLSAVELYQGDRLLNELYVVNNELIDELSSCYCLTTEDHAFFIYLETLVHNFNPVIVGALGSYVIGSVEVLNVVHTMLGVIASLSWYASEYFRSKVVYNYEFSEEESKLTIEQLCLQNCDVVLQIRNYFDTKRRLLNNLHQDLIKVKNDVSAFVRPQAFDFSFGLLSQCKPALYNLSGMISLASEMALSLADKEKLMKVRQIELDQLQQDIFDTHLTLVLHITELIDRRDFAKQQLDEIYNQIVEIVKLRNQNIYNGPLDLLLTDYKTHFIWKELLEDLELRTKELNFVMGYYEKLKNHFFMTKTTNLIDVVKKQVHINNAHLESIQKYRATWWSNMCIIEDCLKRRNLLTDQLVKKYQLIAHQYRAERDKNPILLAQKKKDDIKKQFNKESEDKKKGGGGGGPEDPKDPDNKPPKIIGYFKNVFTHAFTGEEGHLIDTPANRILILEMASNIKNYIIKDVYGNYWYAKTLENGMQLWAWARDGLIRDCGINKIARVVTKYGLCKDIAIK